jgi:hypothetical protein
MAAAYVPHGVINVGWSEAVLATAEAPEIEGEVKYHLRRIGSFEAPDLRLNQCLSICITASAIKRCQAVKTWDEVGKPLLVNGG